MRRHAIHAFTLIETLVVTAIILILAGLLLTAVTSAVGKAKRVQCISNLRNVALAARMRADEGRAGMPMIQPGHPGLRQPAVVRSLQISGELKNPQLLICASDVRYPAKNWQTLTNGNISYFMSAGLGPLSPVAGDRNLRTNSVALGPGNINIRPNSNPSWGEAMHKSKGNIAFGDGSVQQLNSSGLAKAIPGGLSLTMP